LSLVFCDLYTSSCWFWCCWQLTFLICKTMSFHTSFFVCSSCKNSEIVILSADSEISQQNSEFSFIHVWTSCWKIKSICVVLTYLNTVCVNFIILVPVFTSFIENVKCCSLSIIFEILNLNCLINVKIYFFSRNNVYMIFFLISENSIICQFNIILWKQTCRLFLIIVSFLLTATFQTQSVKM